MLFQLQADQRVLPNGTSLADAHPGAGGVGGYRESIPKQFLTTQPGSFITDKENRGAVLS